MPFSRPTLQQIVDRINSDIVSRITGATTSAMRSVVRALGIALSGAAHLLYGFLDNQSKELFATTATADSGGGKLDTIGGELNVTRKAATAATANVVCTGTPNTVIPAGSELVSAANNQYTVNADTTIPAGGSVTTAVTAEVVGAAGNDIAGITLTFISPIVGVNSTATVDSNGVVGGTDDEKDDAYRQRVLARKRRPPHGGCPSDLEQWALEVAGVTRAWASSGYYGVGTVVLYFVCDSQNPITPTSAQIATVLAYLLSHTDSSGDTLGAPVTMQPGLFVAAPTLRPINFTINLYPNDVTTQGQVTAELTDFLLREGSPGQTLYLSRIGEAISAAANEQYSVIVSPAADVGLAASEVAVLGTVTFNNY